MAPSSVEKAICDTVFTPLEITAAQDETLKQLSARIPWPRASEDSATTDCDEAL